MPRYILIRMLRQTPVSYISTAADYYTAQELICQNFIYNSERKTDTLSSHSMIPLRRLPSLTLYLRMCVLPSTISSDIYPYIWKRKPNKAPTSLTSCGDVLQGLTCVCLQERTGNWTKNLPESSLIMDTASYATDGGAARRCFRRTPRSARTKRFRRRNVKSHR